MSKLIRGALALSIISTIACTAQTAVVEQANELESKGQFKRAAGLLRTTLQGKSLAGGERKKLEFESDRLERIKKDFPYTKEALFAELKQAVKDLTSKEFEHWVNEGRF